MPFSLIPPSAVVSPVTDPGRAPWPAYPRLSAQTPEKAAARASSSPRGRTPGSSGCQRFWERPHQAASLVNFPEIHHATTGRACQLSVILRENYRAAHRLAPARGFSPLPERLAIAGAIKKITWGGPRRICLQEKPPGLILGVEHPGQGEKTAETAGAVAI
jgi:hypothetical protein